MFFTTEEMYFLNQLSDGPEPANISLELPKLYQPDIGEKIMEGLQEKQVLDKNKKLTRAGFVPVRALEIYKNAAEHIRLNGLCIGLTPDRKMITIAARKDGYEMLSIVPEVLIYVFLSHLGFLQGMDDKEDSEQQESLTFHRWKNTVDDCRDYIVLEKFSHGNPEWTKIYYASGNEGYVYHLRQQTRTRLSPYRMRLCLMADCRINSEHKGGTCRWGTKMN